MKPGGPKGPFRRVRATMPPMTTAPTDLEMADLDMGVDVGAALSPWERQVLYPNRYAWYVLVSALDVMLTVTLLVHLGGREVNMLAQRSIEAFGTWGLIGLKFLSVVLVVTICEWVGRQRFVTGRRVATSAIFISLIPITAAVAQIGFVLLSGDLEWQAEPDVHDLEFVLPANVPVYLPGTVSAPMAIPAPASPTMAEVVQEN
jgi:hypothetical protein